MSNKKGGMEAHFTQSQIVPGSSESAVLSSEHQAEQDTTPSSSPSFPELLVAESTERKGLSSLVLFGSSSLFKEVSLPQHGSTEIVDICQVSQGEGIHKE